MEEGETAPQLSRKELRKQKLIEYLSAKGRMKLPNPRPYLRDDCQIKKSVTPAVKVFKGKENKASADTFRYKRTKVPNVADHATTHPARKPFGDSNRANVGGSILTTQKNVRSQSSASDSGNSTRNSLFTGLGKSHLNSACHSDRQPRMWHHTKVGRDAVASSVSVKSVSTRMSLCPIVKTKTGLIPAVTQPRNTNCGLSQASAKPAESTTTKPASKKLHSSTSATGSLKSLPSLKKTPGTTALNNHSNKKTTGSSMSTITGFKMPPQNKSNKSKPLLDGRCLSSHKGHLANEPKSLPFFTGRAAPVKPVSRGGTTKTERLAGKSTDGAAQQKSEAGGQKNGQTYKASTQRSSVPASRGSFPADRWIRHSAVVELGGRAETNKETQSKKGQCSSNAPPPQTGLKPGARVMSRRASQPVPSTCRTDLPTGTKTPKVSVRVLPQTEGKKLTAAQEERMRKLQEWREAKGISYKRPPMPTKPQVRRTVAVPQPFWAAMKEEDDAHSLICAIDTSLGDCVKLLRESCHPDQVKEVLSRLPTVSRKFAKYWICQVLLMEHEGNLDVLPVFEEAVGVVLEPIDELRTVVFEILKRRDELEETKQDQLHSEGSPESSNNPMVTPKPVRVLISGEKGNSSVVKYKITGTPGGPSKQKKQPARVKGQEVRFFTPVRRSVRIEEASPRYPVSLQDHDLCVASYSDLISEEDKDTSGEQEDGGTGPSAGDAPMFIYRENEALKDKVLVQLVCD